MAELGFLEFTVRNSAGSVISGASVEIRRQGAQVSGGQGSSPYTVDSPNGVVAGDVVALNTGSTTRTVSAITATTVTTSGGDLGAVSDDDRITIASALPTLYEDAEGATSKTNPLTTSATGRATCYVTAGRYDALVSGGGATTALYVDQLAAGGTSTIVNLYPSGSSVAYSHDTLRDLAAGDVHTRLRSAGATIFSVAGDGEIVAGEAGATHTLTGTLTTTGALTVQAGGAAVTGAVTATTSVAATTTVTGGTGVTATTGNIQATAGDVICMRLKASLGTDIAGGNVALSAGWGVGASVSMLSGSNDACGSFEITSGGSGLGSQPTLTLTFADGTYSATPIAIVSRSIIGDQVTIPFAVGGSPTTAVFTFLGTPTAATVYGFNYAVIGK